MERGKGFVKTLLFLSSFFHFYCSSLSLLVLLWTCGEMLINFVPTVSGVPVVEAPSDSLANVTIVVSQFRGQAAFSRRLHDNGFGQMLTGILKENDVRSNGVTFDQGGRTALAFVTLHTDVNTLLKSEELNLSSSNPCEIMQNFLRKEGQAKKVKNNKMEERGEKQ